MFYNKYTKYLYGLKKKKTNSTNIAYSKKYLTQKLSKSMWILIKITTYFNVVSGKK